MSSSMTAIVWFRRDLRLADNPALLAGHAHANNIVPVFIYAPHEEAPWEPGAASNWWLHHSLAALQRELAARGSKLVIRRGDSLSVLQELITETGADAVFWNRLYEPAIIARDKMLKVALKADGLVAESFNAALINEPWTIQTDAGAPYKVFTPYWRKARRVLPEIAVTAAPAAIASTPVALESLDISALDLLPTLAWAEGFADVWTPGEAGGLERLDTFVASVLQDYAEGRNHPGRVATSKLSPHLHFGEVSPRQVAVAVLQATAESAALDTSAEKYLAEIGWREFAHNLLYYFPETTEQPLYTKFHSFPWRDSNNADYRAWSAGSTGIPFIDAGMRELWQTGWMHNRVRMVVASFLTKNQMVSWREGASWFWDTLVDADLASNTLGWQWAAGCGADAAPFFRIFNPVRQGERFDTEGIYVRQWCPELSALTTKQLQQPWTVSAEQLGAVGVILGENYPEPVIDLAQSRKDALEAYALMRELG
jgi:deoxyribodipyrimidine photo-lyase